MVAVLANVLRDWFLKRAGVDNGVRSVAGVDNSRAERQSDLVGVAAALEACAREGHARHASVGRIWCATGRSIAVLSNWER